MSSSEHRWPVLSHSAYLTSPAAPFATLCYIVAIHPRMHHFSLIEGTASVDVKDFWPLRIEGTPAASPSFWTGRPRIEREYTVVDGFSFPQHSQATSKAFFGGKSELDIEYSRYAVLKQ